MISKRTIMFLGFVCVFALVLSLSSILFAKDGDNPAKKIGGVWIGYHLSEDEMLTVNTATIAPTNNSSGRSFTITMSHVNALYGADPYSYHGEGYFTGPNTYEGTLVYNNGEQIRICKFRGVVLDENTLIENHRLSFFAAGQDTDPKDGMPDEGIVPITIPDFEMTLYRMVPATLPLELEFPEYPMP